MDISLNINAAQVNLAQKNNTLALGVFSAAFNFCNQCRIFHPNSNWCVLLCLVLPETFNPDLNEHKILVKTTFTYISW
jgi:hypothetical protein